MLKSELESVRDIRTSLNIARLGPGGGKDFRDKVTTVAMKQDFEKSFSDPKAFKLFMKSLQSVKETSYTQRKTTGSQQSRNAQRRSTANNGRGRLSRHFTPIASK